ncbi:MAG: hypothetical protein QOJ81_1923 [Chloroflexota bacterium]|jgi:parallel beta-helix repeat protein|nr:hypothetical protein [Chloroflexota bacterium]
MNPPYRRAVLGGILALALVGVIPGVALAAQPSCGDSLIANTTLTGPLDCSGYAGNALTLSKDGIELNLNGYTIWGFAGDDGYYAVDTGGSDRVLVRNGTIANAHFGLYAYASSSSVFRGLTITGEAADADDYGVYSDYGAGNLFKKLTISDVYIGMYLEYGASHRVVNSVATADSIAFETYEESYTNFRGNVAHAPYGFYDDYSGGLTYNGNRANDGTYGFYLDCDDYGRVTLINNVANGNSSDGFYLYYCDENNTTQDLGSWVSGNIANNNDSSGFDSQYSDNSTFQYNTANGNGSDGFYDYYNIGSTYLYNTAKNNTANGFYFDYPTNYVIKWNLARGNGDSGLEFADNYSSAYYNAKDVSFNTATYNDYGLYGSYGVPGKGNIANHNTTDNCYNVVCN